jgi:hypothetical protein
MGNEAKPRWSPARGAFVDCEYCDRMSKTSIEFARKADELEKCVRQQDKLLAEQTDIISRLYAIDGVRTASELKIELERQEKKYERLEARLADALASAESYRLGYNAMCSVSSVVSEWKSDMRDAAYDDDEIDEDEDEEDEEDDD